MSHYRRVTEAPQQQDLIAKLSDGRHVQSTKVVGHHDGKTTVNLLNRKRRIVMQVDIWQAGTSAVAGAPAAMHRLITARQTS